MAGKKSDKQTAGGDIIQANIGDNAEQVAVGKNIQQQHVSSGRAEISGADLEYIRGLFEELKQQIEVQAPSETKEAALERVNELQEEFAREEPQPATLEYVRNWFARNLPGMLGALTSVVVNPIVGKVVEAASGLAADELKRRFGG